MGIIDKNSLWFRAWGRFKQNRLALVGLLTVIAIALFCFIGPIFIQYSYEDQNLALAGMSPSMKHWLGTDLLGRDLLSRILYGGRISFLVAIVASFVSLGIGIVYGVISGWVGGSLDCGMMRILEIIYSLPYTIFVILLMVFIGRGIMPLLLAIGAVEWLVMARLVRGQVIFIKDQPYIHASRVLGQSPIAIIQKHVISNILGTIIICITLTVPNVMLLESFISFLGLGIQAPMTSWGDLIKEGALSMETCPWLIIFPSLFFSLTLFSLNFLGDGLRDILDPRSSSM